MQNKPSFKYLIVGPSWIGDMVMAQSLFIKLKLDNPNAIIDLLAPAWSGNLLERMPQIRQLITNDFQHGKLHLKARIKLAKELRDNQYDQAIILPNSIKSAIIPWLARIPVRTGFVGEQRYGLINDIRKLNKKALPMTVQRFLALSVPKKNTSTPVSPIPLPHLIHNKKSAEYLLSMHNMDIPKGRVLALCPGAQFGSAKQWPTEHYAQTARYFLKQGWQIWLFGSMADKTSCHEILQLACQKNRQYQLRSTVFAGKTSLTDAIDLLSISNLVICNDSGLMHIAASLNKPTVAVYGSTDPKHTPPLGNKAKIVRLTNLSCSPCFKRTCPLKHLDCLNKLPPQQVISAANQLLK